VVPPRDELYNYSLLLPFEEGFSPVPSTLWMQQNWYHSLTLSLVYAICIYVGQKIMSRRSAYELDSLLTVWNTILAVFSIMGALRMSPEFFHALLNHGFQYSVCTGGFERIMASGFWTEMFVFSKALELIDTIFIVLRKRSLIFLHWYHHITVLIYTWHAYKDSTAAGRWFVWMNYTVHACMYSYYALRSCGWRFPKWIPMSITSMQLAQMIIGCLVSFMAYRVKAKGQFCQQTYENLYFSFAIYFSYFLLFARFFYDVYLKRGNRYAKHEKKFNAKLEYGERMNGSNGVHIKSEERMKVQ
jgi:hypothetical protein